MDKSFAAIIILLAGITLVSAAIISHAILLEPNFLQLILLVIGIGLIIFGSFQLRKFIFGLFRGQRAEIIINTAGTLCIVLALGYLSNYFSIRIDMTKEGAHSLSKQTIEMLKKLQNQQSVFW